MTPEEKAEVAPSADNFSKVFGDRTEEPMSVTAADTAVSLATPVDSVVEVQKELQKEEPDYLKIGMLAGVEALGSIPALGPVAKSMVRKGADLAKQTDNVIKLPPKKRSFENFNFDELNLSDAEIEAYADIYNRLGGSREALTKAEKRIIDTIKAREPKIEKALSDALGTNKGIVTLQDYKNAVAATTNYDSIKDAAKAIADQEQLLNKMGASIANDMSFDDAVDSVFDVYYSKGASNDDLTESLLNAGYQQELVDYAVTENAIRKSYNKFISNKGTGDVPSKPRPLTLDATSDAVDDLGFSEKDLADWKKVNYAKDKFRIPPDDEMAAAATNLREGKITSEEFRKLSDERQPIKPITEMPKFPTKEEVVKALHATDPRKTKKGVLGVNKSIEDGTLISSRLDIPAYNNSDTWVVSLHDGSVKDGKTVGYGQSAVLNNVNFTSNPLAASKIATGSAKTTIARMQGEWQNMNPEEVYKTVENLFDDPEWVQVGMNPYRASYFYDKADGMPVVSAEQVMQVGPLVFAKKAKKTTPDDPQFQFENKVTGVKANFNEGGMAMDEQTQMAFALGGSVEDVDPVSGNEVPTGSLPEEVRDDIPAQLSEGEYVVPADVVRFYGVKFFEDLRTQAKQGFADMEANGRIGGEPIPPDGMEMVDPEDEDFPFDISELQTVAEDQPMVNMKDGGYLRGYNEGGFDAPVPTEIPDVSSVFESYFTGDNIEYKEYRDPATGAVATLRFVNGQPDAAAQAMIDAGYVVSENYKSPEITVENPATGESTNIRPNEEQNKANRELENVNKAARQFEDYEDEELFNLATNLGSPKINKAFAGLSTFAGPVGLIAQIGKRATGFAVARELEKRYRATDDDAQKAKIQKLFDDVTRRGKDEGQGILGGGGVLGGGGILNDMNNDGVVNFLDTWAGDQIDDSYEGPSLSDSFHGARRTGGTGTKAKKSLDDHKPAKATTTSGGKKDDITKPAPKSEPKPKRRVSNNNDSGPSAAQIAQRNAQAASVAKSEGVSAPTSGGARSVKDTKSDTKGTGNRETYASRISRGGGFNKGGLMQKNKKKK